MKKIVLCVFALLILAGCASQPVPTSEAISVPTEQIISSKYATQSAGTGEVIVKRDSGASGSACSNRIFFNGEPIADLNVSEKVVSYLPEGEYIISAKPNNFCPGGLVETKANIRAGTRSTYRIGRGSNGDVFLHPTAF